MVPTGCERSWDIDNSAGDFLLRSLALLARLLLGSPLDLLGKLFAASVGVCREVCGLFIGLHKRRENMHQQRYLGRLLNNGQDHGNMFSGH